MHLSLTVIHREDVESGYAPEIAHFLVFCIHVEHRSSMHCISQLYNFTASNDYTIREISFLLAGSFRTLQVSLPKYPRPNAYDIAPGLERSLEFTRHAHTQQ